MIKKLLSITIFSASLFAMGGPSLVETSKVVKSEVNPLQEFVGTIKFDKKSVLAAQNSGVVKAINFEIGDKVNKNKTLVQIDADILNAQIQSAKATATSTKRDYERYTKLLENKSISQKEFDDIKVKYIAAKSTLQELQIQAVKKRIKAPYNAVVVERHVDLGEWVNAGSPAVTVVDTSKVEITFNIPLSVINGLKKNDIYDVTVSNNSLKAKLIAAIPAGDKLTRTFPVKFKADIKDSFVFDGQEAKVSLSKNGKTEALVVPRDAVIKRFGQNVVFTITDKMTAQMMPVQIIGYLGDKIAISAQGLSEGMDVVSKGNERVFPNSPVKVLNK
ncbi:MAG: efflux RND transporter periplasmic adaptor subunit [Halarcobacter ebronensis]|uniref:efflux RND transporter periplasmic adaptor subunit n=1 Tax=Halarcobacter ebronensis TaxID=1462615 RepID=UPI003C71DADB